MERDHRVGHHRTGSVADGAPDSSGGLCAYRKRYENSDSCRSAGARVRHEPS